jgi:hypothetical protein
MNFLFSAIHLEAGYQWWRAKSGKPWKRSYWFRVARAEAARRRDRLGIA